MTVRRPETRRAGAHVIGENALGLHIARMQLCRQRFRILRPRQHGAVDRGNVRADLFAMLLRIQLAHAQFRCRLQHAG